MSWQCASTTGSVDANLREQAIGLLLDHRITLPGRLASLEKYLASSEPMPFVVDDVLVDFDDELSKAALNAPAALAEKTRVILFTRHSRLVEQARGLRPSAQVQVQEL